VIRVKKPSQAPAVLLTRGALMALQLCEQYDANPESYKNGSKRFGFDANLYRSKSVKKALQGAQHGKCALCESKVTHIAYGDVEHFRPKAAYRQSPDDPLVRPGYYWLAYERRFSRTHNLPNLHSIFAALRPVSRCFFSL
jgi:hypothetical protein